MTGRSDLLGVDFTTFSAWLHEHVGHARRFHAAAFRHLHLTGLWDPAAVPAWQEAERSRPGILATLAALADGDQVPTVSRRLEADDGDRGRTIKLLLRLADGAEVETVVIPMGGGERHTVCVSSQVGCGMGCGFCQTARMGLVRQLSAHEIIGQVLAAGRELGTTPRNVVFMGMGEPLDNVEAVAAAVAILTGSHGLKMAHRHITVSTVGRADIFPRLAELGLLRSNLAVSLTVADDTLRSKLMPVNRRHDLATLKAALLALPFPPGRRLMVSCAVIRDINDSLEQADRLIAWVQGLHVLVNLIPCNPIPGSAWQRPDDATLIAFRNHIEAAGVAVRMRLTKGDAVLAACGQLGDPAKGRSALRRSSLTPVPAP